MTGYELSRAWFDFSFENPEKIKPIHTAIYFFAIEHCNRLGWKQKFGFPSQMVMEALGIKNWRTYSKGLNDLIGFGFIEMIEKSTNQYSSNIIAIVKNTKALDKALDKALSKHSTKQGQSIDSIDKQYNNKQYNKEQETIILSPEDKNKKDSDIVNLIKNEIKPFFNLKELSTAYQFLNSLNGDYDNFKGQFNDYKDYIEMTNSQAYKKAFKNFIIEWNDTDWKAKIKEVQPISKNDYPNCPHQKRKIVNGIEIFRYVNVEGKKTINKNF